MTKKLIEIIKFILPVALFCLVLFVGLKLAHAQGSLGPGWAEYLKDQLPGFQDEGETGQDVAASVIRRGITIIKYMVGAVALLFGIMYAMALVFSRGREEVITKQKQNFLWIFVGFIVIMMADFVSQIFNPETATSDALIDFGVARDRLRDIADYLKWLFGSVIILLMTISGIRMVTASGNEEVITKEKRHLVWSGIGMLVILLGSNIVNAIYVVNEETGQVAAARAEAGITEIGGVIRLILAFLGPVAVIITIYAGFMLLTAFENEERAKKAKTMIVAGVTGIVIIYAAYAIVNTIIAGDIGTLPPPT